MKKYPVAPAYADIMHNIIPRLSARAIGGSLVLWLFGICTTLLLVGMWGRSVTSDQVTLEEGARAVLESELVNRRMTDWLTEAVTQLSAVGPEHKQTLVDELVSSPELDQAIAEVVDATVAAALAPPDRPSTLNLQPAVDRLEPAIDRALAGVGLPLDATVVTGAFDDLVFSSNDMALAAGSVAGARSLLTTVVLVGLIGMILTGAIAVWTSEGPLGQLRSLSWRVALSSFTFAVMLRLGSWAVDPEGGRSPIAAGSAIVLGSNGHVPAVMGLAFATVGTAMSTILVRRRRRLPVAHEEPTGEQPVLIEAH